MFPDTPEPKSKHPVPALGTRKLVAMSGHLKALGVGNTERYNEMSLCSISLYRAAGQARCYASVAKRHIAYQQVFKIPSASASTRPHGLRKPAARYLTSDAMKRL